MSPRSVLVLAETHLNDLADVTCELLAAARQLATATGGEVMVLALGPAAARHVEALSAADRILVVDDPQLADYSPQSYLAVLEHVVEAQSPRAVLIGSTSIGLDLAPMLAANLDVPVVGGCRAVRAAGDVLKVTSSFFAGKMLADLTVAASPAVLMIRPGSFRRTEQPGRAEVEIMPSPVRLRLGKVTFERVVLPPPGDVDITHEDFLVAVGRGIQQEDNLQPAEELAKALGGELAASRPIVDQGWLPATRQVGKSAMIVKPRLYLALGISGAPEHQEGMLGSELTIAVNTDPAAPIFDVAQYGVEMDLLQLIGPLTEALRARKRAVVLS